jgi:lipoprotein-releasing system permease protein
MQFLFAWRYFKAPKSTQAINWIARISVLGITVGTMALILVLSVFNGFEEMVKSLYSSFYPDWALAPKTGKVLTISAAQLEAIQKIPGVEAASVVMQEKALLQAGENQVMVNLKGVDPSYAQVSGVPSHLVSGNFETGTADFPLLVLGVGVESALNILADRNLSPLTIYLPKKTTSLQVDWTSAIQIEPAQTAASFLIQQDFDDQYAITSLAFMQKALQLQSSQATGVEIKVTPAANASAVRATLERIMGEKILVRNRFEQNETLYKVMRTEKWIVYGVLSLILVVAAFTMIGALTMLVLEKQKDIRVLHALGADQTLIRKIFINEGVLLAWIGGSVGMILAALLATLQLHYHLIPLEGGSFLIDYYPVQLKIEDFLLVGATVFFIAIIASWLPASRAAKAPIALRES